MEKNLGRGLQSLISNVASEEGERIVLIPVEKIQPNPHQPRTHIDHQSLEELIASIKEHGIIQPLIVTETDRGYQLIAGERRWRSAEILHFKTVPALIRKADAQKKLELALIENIQRQDLNPIERARAYQKLLEEFNLTHEAIARRVSKSRVTVTNSLRLLTLPPDIQKALMSNQISEGQAKVLLSLETEKAQRKFLRKILSEHLTVRQAEQGVRKIKKVKTPVSRNPEFEAKEELLREVLGTRVTIATQGHAGRIEIEFYSTQELNEIINKIIE